MKSIISKALFACASIFLVSSCTEDMEFKDVNVTPVKALYEPADEKAVELQASATAALFFEWESSKAEDSGAPLYEVVFDKADGDFSNPIYKVLSDENGGRNYATISHKVLNNIGAKAGLNGGETGTIKWSVIASRGINVTPVQVSRKLTVTRLLGFAEIPAQVFLTGEATEGGNDPDKAMACSSPEADVFEIFARLKGGKPYRLVSSKSADAQAFHVSGNSILEGDGESTVEEDGVYRMTFDFSIASVKIQKIDKVEFFFCPSNKGLFELPYVGNGVFSATGAIEFHQESWGRDERYKFLMTYADGSQVMWGAESSIDSKPNGAGQDDSYWYAYEWPLTQWDQKWKLENDYDHFNPFTISLIFNVAHYRHYVEPAGSAPEPPVETELKAPASMTLAGEATEGGNISCKKLDDNTFEVFTRLKGGKTFTANDEAFHAEDGVLKPGKGTFTVEKDGVYCLTFDFANATFKAEEVTRLSVFDCWHDHGSAVLDLDYAGGGEWAADGVAFDSSRNTDNRYKFIMEIGGKTQQWGCVKDYDKTPAEAGNPEDYFDLKRVGDSQWDDKFKFNGDQMDKKLHIVVKLHDTYTHSVETAE